MKKFFELVTNPLPVGAKFTETGLVMLYNSKPRFKNEIQLKCILRSHRGLPRDAEWLSWERENN